MLGDDSAFGSNGGASIMIWMRSCVEVFCIVSNIAVAIPQLLEVTPTASQIY